MSVNSVFRQNLRTRSPNFSNTKPGTPLQIKASAGGAADQNLSASLFANVNTFYVPVVTSTYSLAPSLFGGSNIFYSATVSQPASPQELLPALFVDADTFLAASVGTTYPLTVGLLSNGSIFYAPQVTSVYSLSPGLFTDGDVFYGATADATYSLSPGILSEDNVFHAATVGSEYSLSPALFSEPDTFYAASVSTDGAGQELFVDLLVNANTFYEIYVSADTENKLSYAGSGGKMSARKHEQHTREWYEHFEQQQKQNNNSVVVKSADKKPTKPLEYIDLPATAKDIRKASDHVLPAKQEQSERQRSEQDEKALLILLMAA